MPYHITQRGQPPAADVLQRGRPCGLSGTDGRMVPRARVEDLELLSDAKSSIASRSPRRKTACGRPLARPINATRGELTSPRDGAGICAKGDSPLSCWANPSAGGGAVRGTREGACSAGSRPGRMALQQCPCAPVRDAWDRLVKVAPRLAMIVGDREQPVPRLYMLDAYRMPIQICFPRPLMILQPIELPNSS